MIVDDLDLELGLRGFEDVDHEGGLAWKHHGVLGRLVQQHGLAATRVDAVDVNEPFASGDTPEGRVLFDVPGLEPALALAQPLHLLAINGQIVDRRRVRRARN